MDSTKSILEEVLKSTLTNEADIAELEHFLYERPAFEVLDSPNYFQNDKIEIPLYGHGKRGLTYGSVEAIYGTARSMLRLEFNFAVTVYGTLELHTFDIIALPAQNGANRATPLCRCAQPRNQFLLLLEFRNVWIRPLDLVLRNEADSLILTKTFDAGQTQRVPVVLSEISLPPTSTAQPLPRKRHERQIVSVNAAHERSLRETWWHRLEILKTVAAQWIERGSNNRVGIVELRGINLNARQLQIIRKDPLQISSACEVKFNQSGDTAYQLTLRIQNHQGTSSLISVLLPDSEVICSVHLQSSSPSGIDLNGLVFYDGLSESAAITICAGQLAIWVVDIFKLTDARVEIGVLIVEHSSRGRSRQWAARVCQI
jgi:hypothetical protein